MTNVEASEPFPKVKCLNGSTASEAAVGWSQRPYNRHIYLTFWKAGLSLQCYFSSFVGSAALLIGAGMVTGTSAACLGSFLDPL